MEIRSEELADRFAIHAVHVASFSTAGEARLVDALRASGALRLSLVAMEGDEVVGHVAFSPVTIADAPDRPGGLGLAPLAVLPSHRRRGIGLALVRAGLAACEEAGCGFVVVLGDPEYYGRCGFRPAGARGLRDEYGGGDAFQVFELRPGAIPPGGGAVRYAPEFAQVDGGGTGTMESE